MPSGVHGTNRGEPAASRPKLNGMKAVDVLERVNPFDHGRLVDLPGQGQLHQDAMDRRIGVQAVDCGQELILGGLAGQPQDGPVHPGRLAGGLLVADVDLAGRIVAHQDDGQAGYDPGFER